PDFKDVNATFVGWTTTPFEVLGTEVIRVRGRAVAVVTQSEQVSVVPVNSFKRSGATELAQCATLFKLKVALKAEPRQELKLSKGPMQSYFPRKLACEENSSNYALLSSHSIVTSKIVHV